MATITTINASDAITDSRAVINTNFANLNSDKIETSYLDTDTALAANSDTKIATQKAVKSYVDTQGGANASTTVRGVVEEATQAEIDAGSATGGTGARLFINPSTVSGSKLLKFGGSGADGALAITSGATNIDLGGALFVVKNYTSISITGTGSLTFSNAHASGTKVILKSQGAITLTSSTAPMIVASGLGGDGGAGGNNTNGSTGTTSGSRLWLTNAGTGATKTTSVGSGGALPVSKATSTYYTTHFDPYPEITCGAGGGGAAGEVGGAVGGNGGKGGGALVIECGGTLNFTTASGISVNGSAGAVGTGTRAGGGGGGGGGMCLLLYSALTAASGTITSAGGTGGNCVSDSGNAYGGGGGASASNAGSNGSVSGTNGAKTGGDGGAGVSIIAQYV